LDDILAEGPQPSLKVYAAADRGGLSQRTLRRAARELGVKRTRDGLIGQWFMYLPNHHSPSVRTSTTPRTRAMVESDRDRDHDNDEPDGDCDDESNYENGATGGRRQWIVAIAVIICGLGGVVFLRRRFASFSNRAAARSLQQRAG
jgi:hypothetical protein